MKIILWAACQRGDSELVRLEVEAGPGQYHNARERLEREGCEPPFVFFSDDQFRAKVLVTDPDAERYAGDLDQLIDGQDDRLGEILAPIRDYLRRSPRRCLVGPTDAATEAAAGPLRQLIDTIEATGGLLRDEHGQPRPLADEDWIDLGEAYLGACRALGREPMIQESHEDDDDAGRDDDPPADSPAVVEPAEAMPLTVGQKHAHLKAKGSCCPGCGSDQIEGDSFDVESGLVSQQVRCLDCERRWADVYRLAEVEG